MRQKIKLINLIQRWCWMGLEHTLRVSPKCSAASLVGNASPGAPAMLPFVTHYFLL